MPHLLTLSYYLNAVGQSGFESEKIVGAFPGIRLQALDEHELAIEDIEIDVAWIEDGSLVIGECKTNGKELTSREVRNYLAIAELMRCKRVVFSALDGFDSLGPDLQDLINNAAVSIELLTGEQLFDQYPGKHITLERRGSSDKVPTEGFELNVKGFLQWSKEKELHDRL